MPGGQPTKYDPKTTPNLAKGLAMQGMTDEEIAEGLKISTPTLYLWRNTHPQFLEALRAGKEATDDRVENALLRRALGYRVTLTKEVPLRGPAGSGDELAPAQVDQDYPPDIGAAKLWLSNRRPDKWREKVEQIHSGSVTIVDDIPKV